MNIGRVVGTVVCTVKTPAFEGIKLMVVRQLVNGVEKGLVIACDGTRQAGIGDTVYMIGRAEAALMLSTENPPPSDLTIAGIIDPETLQHRPREHNAALMRIAGAHRELR